MKRFYFISAIIFIVVGLVAARQTSRVYAPKGILRHTVAFNFKPDVSQQTIEEILADTRKELPTIQGATNIVIGPQTSNRTKYKYGLSIDFVNKDAKEAYAKSPQSRRLHEQYKQFTEDEVVIDIVSE